MKVIFLDIDGVLNNEKLFQDRSEAWKAMPRRRRKEEQVMPKLLARLKRIYDEGGARIVLSSSWRKTLMLRSVVVEKLARAGMELVDLTPGYRDAADILGWPIGRALAYPRGMEIHAWLQSWRMNHAESIEAFVVLDDRNIVYKDVPGYETLKDLNDHFVKTDSAVGLTEENVVQALRILETQKPAA